MLCLKDLWRQHECVLTATNSWISIFWRWPTHATLCGFLCLAHACHISSGHRAPVHRGFNVARLPHFSSVFCLKIYCWIKQFKGDRWVWILSAVNLQEKLTTLIAFFCFHNKPFLFFSPPDSVAQQYLSITIFLHRDIYDLQWVYFCFHNVSFES